MKRRKYKRASSDYSEAMLPQNRREVFTDVVKLHHFDLFKLGLMFLASFLPLLILVFINDVYEAQITAASLPNAAESLLAFQSTSALIGIVCYLIIAIVFSGVLRVIRQLAYEEVLFFWQDFVTGIKQNIKQIFVIAFLMGVQKFIGIYLYGVGQLASKGMIGIVGAIFNGLSVLVFLPVWAYMTVLCAVYDNTFLQNLRVAFALYAKAIGRTVLHLIALGILFAASMLPYGLCHLLCRGFGALLLPLFMLIWFLFVLHQLDKEINPKYFPELVGKGLYHPADPDDSQNNSKGEPAQ